MLRPHFRTNLKIRRQYLPQLLTCWIRSFYHLLERIFKRSISVVILSFFDAHLKLKNTCGAQVKFQIWPFGS